MIDNNKLKLAEKYGSDKAKELINSLPCQHKSDGLLYTSNPPYLKCVKCGKLYR